MMLSSSSVGGTVVFGGRLTLTSQPILALTSATATPGVDLPKDHFMGVPGEAVDSEIGDDERGPAPGNPNSPAGPPRR